MQKMIGIVGGMGPYAGIDLMQKICNQTEALRDQDHLPVAMLSLPHTISDRTDFLLGKTAVNPAFAIANAICELHQLGASVLGMPCNTAYAPPIFDEIVKRIPPSVSLLHMINVAAEYICTTYPSVTRVGILSTTGTLLANIYPDSLSRYGLVGIQVPEALQQEQIHPAIYNKMYGIKAQAAPVTVHAKQKLHQGVAYLIYQGAEVIILGCTEIPLALTEETIGEVPLLDVTKVLARTLVLTSSPEKLQELRVSPLLDSRLLHA